VRCDFVVSSHYFHKRLELIVVLNFSHEYLKATIILLIKKKKFSYYYFLLLFLLFLLLLLVFFFFSTRFFFSACTLLPSRLQNKMPPGGQDRGTALDVFKQLDTDNDGFLKKSDLEGVIRDSARLNEIFSMMDKGGTGKVSFEAFFAVSDKLQGSADSRDLEGEKADQVANLKVEIANLQRMEKTATQRYQNLLKQTSQLDQDNTDLRKQLSEAESKLARAKALESGAEGSLASHKAMVDQFRVQKVDLENQVKGLKHEAQNAQAVLQVERKMKKTHQDENKVLKETVQALQATRSEVNRLTLKKKMGKMNAIMTRRKYVFHLQTENQRLPVLEAENRSLKDKITKLESEAQEYLRLMDSYKHAAGEYHNLETPDDNEGMSLGVMVADDEANALLRAEIEALRKKVRQLEHALQVETARREQVEAQNAILTKELHEEKEKNIALTAENKDLKEQVAQLTETVAEQKKTIVEQQDKIHSLEDEVRRLNELVAQLRAEIERLLAEIAAKDKIIADMAARIAELEKLVADLRRQLEEEIEWRKRLQAQLDALGSDAEKRMAELLAELAATKKLLAEALARIKELEAELERLLAENKRLLEENQRLQSELDKANKALAEALARIAELEAEIKRLLEELEEKQEEVVTIIEERTHVQAGPVQRAPDAPKIVLTPEQQAEVTAYAICMNHYLGGDSHLSHLMPINVETPELLVKISDGLLLSKWMNIAAPGTIDERALNFLPEGGNLGSAEILQNLNLCISAAKSIGVTMKAPETDRAAERSAALGASQAQLQLMECTEPDLSISFIYELIRAKFVPSLSCRAHPELIELKDTPEVGLSNVKLQDLTPKELSALGPDALLLRWLNWHRLAGASSELPGLLNNFSGGRDCVGYANVLTKISEIHNVYQTDTSKSDAARAKYVLEQIKKMGGNHFHRAPMLTAGSERLNLLLAGCIFEMSTGFKVDEDELKTGAGGFGGVNGKDAGVMDSDSREERAFRMWINSAGISGVFLNNLFMDCRDGLALLKVEDWVEPGCVNWRSVEMKPNNKFKCVTNCNIALNVAKNAPLLMSLVGIGGEDIHEGHQTFILAVVWQLMRHHTIKKLAALQGSGGAKLKDEDILKWANTVVKAKPHPMNTQHTVLRSFRDPEISSSLFLFNLIWGIEPKIVDWKMVTPGESPQDKVRNAGYAISVARKLGAEIFLLPHDIVEVKPKMMMLFIGSLMSTAQNK